MTEGWKDSKSRRLRDIARRLGLSVTSETIPITSHQHDHSWCKYFITSKHRIYYAKNTTEEKLPKIEMPERLECLWIPQKTYTLQPKVSECLSNTTTPSGSRDSYLVLSFVSAALVLFCHDYHSHIIIASSHPHCLPTSLWEECGLNQTHFSLAG